MGQLAEAGPGEQLILVISGDVELACTLDGSRRGIHSHPQFIKCALLSREIRKAGCEILVHTGQHYDYAMSQVFFEDLGIPVPDYNLEIGSGSHGRQTGAMMAAIEEVLVRERPNAVVVFGDTNSTLAAALAAAKIHIPIAHVEAGLRSGNRAMPEEINRILTDHVSSLLFCPTRSAVESLALEGITHGVSLTGDVMHEVLFSAASSGAEGARVALGELADGPWALATIHRAENTDSQARFREIVDGLCALAETCPVVWPVHPRAKRILEEYPDLQERVSEALHVIEPQPYPVMARLLRGARVLVTDSGGMQKEAFWLGVPCVTTRDETEWVETVEAGGNVLVGADGTGLVSEALAAQPRQPVPPPSPPVAEVIAQELLRYLES